MSSDTLSEALHQARLQGARYIRLELGAPWSLGYPHGARGVHVVLEGRCALRWDGERRSAVELSAGDMVVVPNGRGHVLCAAGGTPVVTVSVQEVLEAQGWSCPAQHGGPGERTVILCGHFLVDEALDGPAFSALPEAILIRQTQHRPVLRGLMEAIAAEVIGGEPGAELVVARLSDALVVHALREQARQEADVGAGWLGALYDPSLGPVVGALHRSPEAEWTVAQMARAAGMSRSSFAARFAEQLGEPPMRYVTRLRMRRARALLLESDAPLLTVAEAVGYGSEAAFSAAFRREIGESPGGWRRRAGLGDQPSRRTSFPELASSR